MKTIIKNITEVIAGIMVYLVIGIALILGGTIDVVYALIRMVRYGLTKFTTLIARFIGLDECWQAVYDKHLDNMMVYDGDMVRKLSKLKFGM